jgi:hypothetical protein
MPKTKSEGPGLYSATPKYRRWKRVMKEYDQLLVSEGYGSLFGPSTSVSNPKQNLRKTRLIQQAIEFNLWVPQPHVNFVNPPVEVNPRVPPSDPNETPF